MEILKEKTLFPIQRQILHKPAAANIACRLTCCHVPFKGFFPLEKHFPFRWLVRVATRS
jgi:hypothetical protein